MRILSDIRQERTAGLTARQAAAYMGCSYDMMVWYISERKVESYPIGETGKHRRVTRAACDALRVTLQMEHDGVSSTEHEAGAVARPRSTLKSNPISDLPIDAYLDSLDQVDKDEQPRTDRRKRR